MSIPNLRAHVGQNIQRLRELRGMKQSALAKEVGVSQQTISLLESSEEVEDEKLEPIAKALGVTTEAIRRFNGDNVFNSIINDNHDNNDRSINAATYYELSPIDAVTELYERMLQMERDRIKELEQRIKDLEAERKKD